MKCEKCGTLISQDETYEHSGRTICEDCYLDIVATPKTCDPWAVFSTKNTMSQETVLTAEQQKIYDLIKAKGPLKLEQICSQLDISEEAFRREFATLRHMELTKGAKWRERSASPFLTINPVDQTGRVQFFSS